jgi:hypothetical protein
MKRMRIRNTSWSPTYDILDEEDPVAESQRQLVKELDVLQQIVVAGPRVAVLVVMPVYQQLN